MAKNARISKSGSKGSGGCKKGEGCSYFHPTLCKHSFQKRCCTNESCSFVHLKGTKRKDPTNPVSEKQSLNNGKNQRSQKNQAPKASATAPKSSATAPSPNDHFLELRELVKSMNLMFNQEIAAIRASLQQQQPCHK